MRSLLPSHVPRRFRRRSSRPCAACRRRVKNWPLGEAGIRLGWCCIGKYIGPGHPWRKK